MRLKSLVPNSTKVSGCRSIGLESSLTSLHFRNHDTVNIVSACFKSCTCFTPRLYTEVSSSADDCDTSYVCTVRVLCFATAQTPSVLLDGQGVA